MRGVGRGLATGDGEEILRGSQKLMGGVVGGVVGGGNGAAAGAGAGIMLSAMGHQQQQHGFSSATPPTSGISCRIAIA